MGYYEKPSKRFCKNCGRYYMGFNSTKGCPNCKKKKNTNEAFMCKHYDCIYRDHMRDGTFYFCGYILRMRHSRGCDIADCDKYVSAFEVD